MKRVALLIMMLGVMSAVTLLSPTALVVAEEKAHAGKDVYYCPMHPDVTSDHKGSCPICGMDLIKKKAPEQAPAMAMEERKVLYYRNPMDPSVTSPVPMKDPMGMDYVPVYDKNAESTAASGFYVNPYKQQLIGVKTGTVDIRPLSLAIRTTGEVAYDPKLYVAQEEYLQALNVASASGDDASGSISGQGGDLVTAAEKKLLLMGMSTDEIARLQERGMPEAGLYLPDGSGQAWIYAVVYEYESAVIQEGQDVEVTAMAYPGETFPGTIVSVTPVADAMTRSLRIRAQVEDPEQKLKPQMYTDVMIMVDLGEGLSVPLEAVMDSGLRKIVYVVDQDHFVPRDVVVGPRAGNYYEILSGLEEGETVVTSGNFLIDAESRLRGAL